MSDELVRNTMTHVLRQDYLGSYYNKLLKMTSPQRRTPKLEMDLSTFVSDLGVIESDDLREIHQRHFGWIKSDEEGFVGKHRSRIRESAQRVIDEMRRNPQFAGVFASDDYDDFFDIS